MTIAGVDVARVMTSHPRCDEYLQRGVRNPERCGAWAADSLLLVRAEMKRLLGRIPPWAKWYFKSCDHHSPLLKDAFRAAYPHCGPNYPHNEQIEWMPEDQQREQIAGTQGELALSHYRQRLECCQSEDAVWNAYCHATVIVARRLIADGEL